MTELLQDRIPGIEWTLTSAQVTEDLSFEQCQAALNQVMMIGDASRWWIGDITIFAESRYGQKAAQLFDDVRLSERSLTRYQRVAARIDPVRRRQNLSFSHHEEVSHLAPPEQDALLKKAETNRWPVAELRQAVKDSGRLESIPPARQARQEVLPAADVVGAAADLSAIRDSLWAAGRHIRDPEAHPALETAQTIVTGLRALEEASDTVTAAARVVDSQNALDRACRYYREALEHVLEECGNDAPRIDHIREAATRGISAADHELKETVSA